PDPTPPKPAVGSFEYDKQSSKYAMEWTTWAEFQAWLETEQERHGIKLHLTVLGNYTDTHDHPLSNVNLPYTQIPKHTREYIAGLLWQKVAPDHILQLLHRGVYDQDDLFERDQDDQCVASRAEFIELRDIRRIEKQIEAEAVRLHPDDAIS
ncbi:hypothetical protein B0H17DRAFT_876666, partial [Mycena rosella]